MNKFFLIVILLFCFPILGNDGKSDFNPSPGVEIIDIGDEDFSSSTEKPSYIIEKVKIPSGRDKVNAEIFKPASGSNWPIVILLHGSHPKRTDAYYDVMGIDLAMHGYYCVFPHYFERNKKGRGTRNEWMKTISDCIDFAQKQENVNKEKIGVIGYSLGAFLILGHAPKEKRISCVVAFYGGLSPCYNEIASEHMPPTLLLHGTKDKIVPARRSLEAFKTLREYGKPVNVVIYPNVGHGFTLHKRSEWDDFVSLDSWERTLNFLHFYLHEPSWIPEVPQPSLDISSESSSQKQISFTKKFEAPYLEKVFKCEDKIYIDPEGEEFLKVLKESQPPPPKKKKKK